MLLWDLYFENQAFSCSITVHLFNLSGGNIPHGDIVAHRDLVMLALRSRPVEH